MSLMWIVAAVVLLYLIVYWLPPLINVLLYTRHLREMGYSAKQISETLIAEGRRMIELGEAMKRGCGKDCHERYCELDPFDENPHRCHVVDCPDRGN